jgi:hypothetical protein
VKIEDLWSALRRETTGAQRRVDAAHPLELYADFEPPDRPGLILLCAQRPTHGPSLKALRIERRQRQDGMWTLRIILDEPPLLPVFAELCNDIIESTRTGVPPARAPGAVLARIDRWRSLMQAQPPGLNTSVQRGLIGELLFLETILLPELGPDEAVHAWTGPLGTDQDFQLGSALRIEVKSAERLADRVRINGLAQLDAGSDPLELAVVRLEDTGRDADDAVTAWTLAARLRERLADAPTALLEFNALLRFLGWSDDEPAKPVVVRLERIDRHPVMPEFPRLTKASVPPGVDDAAYTIILPATEPIP